MLAPNKLQTLITRDIWVEKSDGAWRPSKTPGGSLDLMLGPPGLETGKSGRVLHLSLFNNQAKADFPEEQACQGVTGPRDVFVVFH